MTRFILVSLSLAATIAAQSISNLKPAELNSGTAFTSEQEKFLFAVRMEREPRLFLDEAPGPKMILGSDGVWTAKANLETGTVHSFHYEVDGKKFGGRSDIPAFGADSYERPGVPQGKLSEKIVHNSKVYPGLASDYWIYVPAQYDAAKPAALMIWQDGQGLTSRDGRSQIVFDNLTHDKKIPVMIHIFISPGKVGEKAWRSIEYDTVNDTYARFLLEEIIPDVAKKYNLRKDGYSRAIAGNSSGGICAFNAAWFRQDEFTRVLSRIGSFTSIQWKPGIIDGGNVYPNKIRKEPKRNIRTWLQDGWNDLENNHGSWPLQNIQMANSLKMMGYDFHLSFGRGTHNGAHGSAELPQAMQWLWRDYDPAKTSQTFEQESEERSKPLFRVNIINR